MAKFVYTELEYTFLLVLYDSDATNQILEMITWWNPLEFNFFSFHRKTLHIISQIKDANIKIH
jgi:hypothetical protein